MIDKFDIIDFICGLTDFNISKSVAINIALKRNVSDVTDYDELTEKEKDLLLADVLVSLAFRPSKTASRSQSHGGYSVSIGSEEINNLDELLDQARLLYGKWEEPTPSILDNGTVQWM